MHYGTENPLVPARTDGKPARAQATVVSRGGILYLELPRDHPRLVQGPHRLARSYGADCDLQPVLSIMNDVAPMPEGMNVLDFIETLEAYLSDLAESDPAIQRARRRKICGKSSLFLTAMSTVLVSSTML